jgi:ankyrin repeat protein
MKITRMNADDGSPTVLLKAVLDRGASPAVRDTEGRDGIMLAALHLHPKVRLETLPVVVAVGVDVNARDRYGKTALDYAREKARAYPEEDRGDVVRLLIASGAQEAR